MTIIPAIPGQWLYKSAAKQLNSNGQMADKPFHVKLTPKGEIEMRIEIRTTNEITSVSFPSITDASLESAVFFIDNGWTESAKRVIENMAREGKEMAEYALSVINDLNDVVESETENVNYWRNLVENRTAQLDTMRAANESLVEKLEEAEDEIVRQFRVILTRNAELDTATEIIRDKEKDLEMWKGISADQSEMNHWYDRTLKSVREDRDHYRTNFYRLEKAFAGISRGYGKLKRAFNAHTKKINEQIEEIGILVECVNREEDFNQLMMSQNAELIERLSNYESL